MLQNYAEFATKKKKVINTCKTQFTNWSFQRRCVCWQLIKWRNWLQYTNFWHTCDCMSLLINSKSSSLKGAPVPKTTQPQIHSTYALCNKVETCIATYLSDKHLCINKLDLTPLLTRLRLKQIVDDQDDESSLRLAPPCSGSLYAFYLFFGYF